MNVETLMQLGLTKPQAKAYILLIKEGKLSPPVLASKIGESRTNAYKILDKLVEIQLAKKTEENKKFVYRPENPVALENLAREARDHMLQQEKQVKNYLPTLLNYFYTYSEQPGVRFFQGEAGIKEIFNDMLRTRKTIYLLRSPADIKFYNEEFFLKFREKRAKLGIETQALTPNVKSAIHSPELDARNKFMRTWLPKEAYDASVEWNAYGDKVAIISYGQEAIGMIIESPQIAESFRRIFKLMQLGASHHTAAK